MDEDDNGTDKPIDLLRDAENDSEQQVDTATYVAAKIFGEVALPVGLSFAKAAAIESQANAAQRQPDIAALIIGNVGGGAMDQKTPEERQREEDREALEYMAFVLEQAERDREWAEQMHSFAGVQMTGAEWGELGDELKQDGELREWLVTRLMKDGKTRGQAEQKANDIADVATIMSNRNRDGPRQSA